MIESYALEKMVDVYLRQFPSETAAEKTHLIKLIKAFYRAKGSEESYQFFFRAAYDVACQIDYPKDNILKVSDGEWSQDFSIRIESRDPNIFDMDNRRIKGKSSNDVAVIEDISMVSIGGFTVYDCRVSSVRGIFDVGEIVETYDNKTKVRGTVFGSVNSMSLITRGTGYSENDTFSIVGGDGVGATVTVSRVSDSGAILGAYISDQGVDYTVPPSTQSLGSGGATASFGIGVIHQSKGRYISERSRISRYSVIQDGKLYQDFSYIVKSSIPVETWYKDVKNYLHPAGLYFVGMLTWYAGEVGGDTPTIDLKSNATSEWLIQLQSDVISTLSTIDSTVRLENSGNLTQKYFRLGKIDEFKEQIIESFQDYQLDTWSRRFARVYPHTEVLVNATILPNTRIGKPSVYEDNTTFYLYNEFYQMWAAGNESEIDIFVNYNFPDFYQTYYSFWEAYEDGSVDDFDEVINYDLFTYLPG